VIGSARITPIYDFRFRFTRFQRTSDWFILSAGWIGKRNASIAVMKPKSSVHFFCVLLALGVSSVVASGQGVFRNLNFEAVILPLVTNDPIGYDRVLISGAMPGWTGYMGTDAQSLVAYNNMTIGSSGISLIGPGLFGSSRIEGSYTALLQAGFYFNNPGAGRAETSLRQTGVVPVDARSLLLQVNAFGPFSVSLGGISLSLIPISAGPNYTLYGADISGFAGLAEELKITALPPADLSVGNVWLDGIQFSTAPVPEPGSLALFGMGAALFVFAGRRAWR
jgi:hypothetical protein